MNNIILFSWQDFHPLGLGEYFWVVPAGAVLVAILALVFVVNHQPREKHKK